MASAFGMNPPTMTELERVALQVSKQESWARGQCDTCEGTESGAYLRGYADAMSTVLMIIARMF